MDDPYNLDRFLTAQNEGGTYDQALAELQGGSKRGHWMWFVFPQIAGLGQSATSRRYAISSLDEARAYLRHPVLGPRLIECADAVAGLKNRTAGQIFGGIDAQKLHSSGPCSCAQHQGSRCSSRSFISTLKDSRTPPPTSC